MRIDKFLKVSRIIKRRTVANEACDASHVSVNGRQVKASYDVKEGDIIEIKESARKIPLIVDSLAKMEREVPVYLDLNKDNFSVKFNAVPHIEDVPYPVVMDVNLVVEFYSR